MVYVVNGRVVQRRSPFRLSIVLDVFWGVVNAVGFFFQTLLDPTAANKRAKGPPPGRRGGPVRGMSNVTGIDHNANCGGGG